MKKHKKRKNAKNPYKYKNAKKCKKCKKYKKWNKTWSLNTTQSTCLKDPMRLLELGPIKYLSERSIDNTSAQAIQVFV